MKAPQIPLEFDILCQGEAAKRILKIGQDDGTKNPSGKPGGYLSVAESFTIKEFSLRVESLAYDLRQTANLTRAQSQQSEGLLKNLLTAKLDYLAAVKRIESLRSGGASRPLVSTRRQH